MNGSAHILVSSLFSNLFNKISIFYTAVFFLFFLVRVHSVSFSFPRSHQNDALVIDCQNDASISSGAIELTKSTIDVDSKGSVGRATYINPVRLWDKSTNKTTNFTTHFSFDITPLVEDDDKPSGDGFTFLLTPFNELTAYAAPNDSSGGCLGLIGGASLHSCNITSYPFVAVEFDTFHNSGWDPGDSTNDPKNDHLGINVDSIKSEVVLLVNDGLKFRPTGNAWISYDSSTKNLSVYLSYDTQHVLNGESNLSYVIDLREVLPEKVRVGYTASTGADIQRHTILSWEFNSTLLDDDVDITPQNPPNAPAPIQPGQSNKSKAILLGGLVVGISVVIIGLGLAVYIWRRRRSLGSADHINFVDDDDFDQDTGPKRLTYNELSRATNNFPDEGKLGEGGFGGVYRGFLTNLNKEIAVKKISRGSKQGKKEYVSEVKIISCLRHKNLVQLIGWCHEQGDLLLVYEYMPNGSLDSHLYGDKKKVTLSWGFRYKIAKDLASALLYLHQEWEQCVLHRDIKSSNVMLDSNFNAKLGDFGLARLVDHNLGSPTTVLAGTLGYLAPECVMTGKSSKESDVYSFGIVALEIACGKRPVESKEEPSKVSMVEWVRELYGKGHILEAVDKTLEGEINKQETMCLLMVGLWCCHPDHASRPSINQAINVLNFESPLPSLPKNFPASFYCSPQMNMFTPNTTQSTDLTASSSGITGCSGTSTTSR